MNMKFKMAPDCGKYKKNPLLSQTNLAQQWKFTIRIWNPLFHQRTEVLED